MERQGESRGDTGRFARRSEGKLQTLFQTFLVTSVLYFVTNINLAVGFGD